MNLWENIVSKYKCLGMSSLLLVLLLSHVGKNNSDWPQCFRSSLFITLAPVSFSPQSLLMSPKPKVPVINPQKQWKKICLSPNSFSVFEVIKVFLLLETILSQLLWHVFPFLSIPLIPSPSLLSHFSGSL